MAKHILVVDDNDLNRMLISKILELESYQVSLASNGTTAIEAVTNAMPDLAILDVMMPDMDGYELCKKLRQPPINAKIPIVMLTAMTSEEEKRLAMEAGANDIWGKPFDFDVFRKSVGELLKDNPE